MSAVYSAFLFRQARGRVFWHSTLTPLHLLVQAMAAGSAVLMLIFVIDAMVSGVPVMGAGFEFLYYEFLGTVFAHGVLMAGELFMPEENVERKRAARLITKGIFSKLFWAGAVILGTVPACGFTCDRGGAVRNNRRCRQPASAGRTLFVGAYLGPGRPSRSFKLEMNGS